MKQLLTIINGVLFCSLKDDRMRRNEEKHEGENALTPFQSGLLKLTKTSHQWSKDHPIMK